MFPFLWWVKSGSEKFTGHLSREQNSPDCFLEIQKNVGAYERIPSPRCFLNSFCQRCSMGLMYLPKYMFLFCAELKMDGTIWDFMVWHDVPMKWEAHVEHVQFRGQWLGRTKAKTRWLHEFKMLRWKTCFFFVKKLQMRSTPTLANSLFLIHLYTIPTALPSCRQETWVSSFTIGMWKKVYITHHIHIYHTYIFI